MSMSGYTKLFGSIITSTIWREPHAVRILWITMLALSDKDGIIEGSVPGLADMARITLQECEEGLEALQAPDEYSRTKDREGRRIEEIDGGWRLLNHEKYREKMGADERREYFRLKKREQRAMSKNVFDCPGQSLTVPLVTHTDTDTDTDNKTPSLTSGEKSVGGGVCEGKSNSRIPTTAQSIRVAAIMHRKPTTPWQPNEVRVYKLLGIVPEEDLAAVEKYYSENWPPNRDHNILRHDLLTLLGNWAGECDRARLPARKPKTSGSQSQRAGAVNHREYKDTEL